ncbi:zinc finger protein RFP-like isoform X2 [Carettochelys insculpta]|uniref:zinc finger protein RFP-like isoform X2 n=1 Tax=Carettochelys insculpta TaxID=44489 RepID=UPI003EBC0017
MAAENPSKSLQDEATCSICLEYFKDPVIIDCGHNFCRTCISQFWEGSETHVSCPQCRETFPQRTLRPNRQLANVLLIAQQLSAKAAAMGRGDLCKVHQEPFKLFCNQDQVLICVICRESQAHRAHMVVPIEEAAQVYKEKIQTRLNSVKKEQRELLEWKQDGLKQTQEYLGKIEAERKKIVSEFEQLRLFLEEQERLLLVQLDDLEKEMMKIQAEAIARLSEEISRLSDLISEIENKCHLQPTGGFLQDIRSTWSRCEKTFQKPLVVPEDLRDRFDVCSQRSVCLQASLKRFQDMLPYQLSFLIAKAEKEVQARVDPDVGNPSTIESKDGRMIYGYQPLTFGVAERFYPAPCVLRTTAFTWGACYWEVEVGLEKQWVMGIAKQAVIEQGVTHSTPEEGIWALEHGRDKYWALTSPKTALDLPSVPRKVGVYLDYEGGEVTFYVVTPGGREPIFTFTSSFTGQIIPFLGSRPAGWPSGLGFDIRPPSFGFHVQRRRL